MLRFCALTMMAVIAWVGAAPAQEPSVLRFQQFLLEPSTLAGIDTRRNLMHQFNGQSIAATGSSFDGEVISVPESAAEDFASALQSEDSQKTLNWQRLPMGFESLVQRTVTDTSTLSQALQERLLQIQANGLTDIKVVTLPTSRFTDSLLSGEVTANSLAPQNTLNILIGEQSLSLERTGVERTSDSLLSWTGQFTDTFGYASLVSTPEGVTGVIRHANDVYMITPLADEPVDQVDRLHAIVRLEDEDLPDHEPEAPPRISLGDPLDDFPGLVPDRDQAVPQELPEISILFAFTPGAVERIWPLWRTALTAARQYLNQINSLVERSRARISYSIADVVALDMKPAPGESFSDLMHGVLNDSDGRFDELHELRDAAAADIVVLFVARGSACGRASQIGATADTAFAIVNVNWKCYARLSFAHEIGHLHGLVHDTHDDQSNRKPPLQYAYGFRRDPAWRTVLATDCVDTNGMTVDCPRLYFSNARLVCQRGPCRGDTLGTQDRHDEVRAMEETAPLISVFR